MRGGGYDPYFVHPDDADPTSNPVSDVLDILVATHRNFRSFLERQVGNRADAEDILQDAYARSLEHGDEIRDGESAVAWFYRLLRNAVIDHRRRQDAQRRALEARAKDAAAFDEPALHDVVCRCIHDLLPALKDEYATLLRRIDLEGAGVAEVASERGTTPNNVRVTLHRARKTLRRQLELSCGTCTEHGCLDCSCGG